jgi:hypothetical protein
MNPESYSRTNKSLNADASLSIDLDLAAVVKHYEREFERAHWLKQGDGLDADQYWSEWTRQTPWSRDAKARLDICRDSSTPHEFEIEFKTSWRPARKFPRWPDPPFEAD